MYFVTQPGESNFPFTSLQAICGACILVLLSTLIKLFGHSPLPILLTVGAMTCLVFAVRHPCGSLGAVLGCMPLFPLSFLIARFFGPPYVSSVEGIDRVVVLTLASILLFKNGVKLIAPDFWLLSCVAIAVVRYPLDGSLIGLVADFGFVIAYGAGRVLSLTSAQELLWAKRAVILVAVLAIVGLVEVFIIGEGPRTILYLSVAEKATYGGALDGSFHASGFSGLRESSTMFGPLQFAPLCMVALIIWWVYSGNLLLGLMIAVGLLCSLSRSAWVGTALAISLLAVIMNQKKRLLMYVALALALSLGAFPFIGLSDFLVNTKTGQDPSAQGHHDSIVRGLQFLSEHPMGIGSANLGRQAEKSNSNAFYFESTYLTFAGEYGVMSLLCLVGFLLSVVWRLLPLRTNLSFVAIAIVAGFSGVISVLALHDVFSLACWIWFPVGLALRSSSNDPSDASVTPCPGVS